MSDPFHMRMVIWSIVSTKILISAALKPTYSALYVIQHAGQSRLSVPGLLYSEQTPPDKLSLD